MGSATENMAQPATWSGTALADSVAHTAQQTSVEALVHLHARYLHGVAYSVVRNHHDAEDVAQETFLRVLRQKTPLSSIENPRAWLSRIAWNLALDKVRSHKRKEEVAIDNEQSAQDVRQLATDGASAEEIASGNQMQALLGKLIATLPEEMRQTLELSLVEGMNSAAMGEVLGIPEGTVRTRLMRARQILKEKFAVVLESSHD